MSRPRLRYFLICDQVVENHGKFSAIGIFDAIVAVIYPARHPSFFLLCGFVGETAQHELEIRVSGPDNAPLGEIKGSLNLPGGPHVTNAVFQFENMPLPMPGAYKITLFIDGDFLAEQPFYVTAPQPQRPSSPEELQALLADPNIIKSATSEIVCSRCNSAYRFQAQLDPSAKNEPGYLPLPPGDFFACGKCSQKLPLAAVRLNFSNLLGQHRQWLPAAPQGGPAGDNSQPAPTDN